MKMYSEDEVARRAVSVMLFTFVVSCLIIIPLHSYILEREVISHHCGQYNPTNGNFEWLTITNR